MRIEHSTIQNNGNYWEWRTDCIMRIYNSHVVLNNNIFQTMAIPSPEMTGYMPEDNFGIFAYGQAPT